MFHAKQQSVANLAHSFSEKFQMLTRQIVLVNFSFFCNLSYVCLKYTRHWRITLCLEDHQEGLVGGGKDYTTFPHFQNPPGFLDVEKQVSR